MRASRMFAASLLFLLSMGVAGAAAQAPTPAGPTAADLFNPAVLHRLDLVINTKDWEKLKANYKTNEYYQADVKWQGMTVRTVGIRSRGRGSRSASKPHLRVDMNRYVTGQTFLGLKSFNLDNLWQDPTGIKEAVAMRLYARLNLPAPRVSFAKVYVNNTYSGLYGIVEAIDKDFLARVYGEHDGDTENDGYLFEYDWHYAWFFTHLGAEFEPYKELFPAKTRENDSDFDKYYDIVEWVRAVNEARDDMFVDEAWKYLDLNIFMKHVAAQAFMAEWDGFLGYDGINNFYLYRFEQKTQHQLIMWDADNTFRAIDYSILQGHQENVLMRRAMQVESLRQAFFEGVLAAEASAAEVDPEEVVASGQSRRGWLEREIDSTLALMQQAMYADPNKPYTNAEFDNATAALREFARRRGEFVKCEVTKATDPAQADIFCAIQ